MTTERKKDSRTWPGESVVVPEFEVFDVRAARAELDRRSGMLVRYRLGRFEVNRPVAEALVEVGGLQSPSVLIHRGALLVFNRERGRAGIVLAPYECDPGMRQPIMVRTVPGLGRVDLSAEWPAAVPCREFLAYWRLHRPLGEVPVELVEGRFEFEVTSQGAGDVAAERGQLRRSV